MYFPGSGNVEHGSFFEKKNKNKQTKKKTQRFWANFTMFLFKKHQEITNDWQTFAFSKAC